MKYYFKIIISIVTGFFAALFLIYLTVQVIDYYKISVSKFNNSMISYICMTLTTTIGILTGRLCYGWLTNIPIDKEEKSLYQWIIIGSIVSFFPALLSEKFLTKKSPLAYHTAPWIVIFLIIYICRRLYLINISCFRGYSLWIVTYKENISGTILNYQLIVEAKDVNEAEKEVREHSILYPSDTINTTILSTRKINNEIYFKFLTVLPEGKKGILTTSIL